MRNIYRMRGMQGFTLIEIIVVITIAVILFAIILAGFSGLRSETDLSVAADDVVSFLQEARTQTLSSQGATPHGVHFETNKFVLFVGDTYNVSDPGNKDRVLPPSLEISDISLEGAGTTDVVFKRLTGETEEYGSVTLRIVNKPSATRIITIMPTGLAGVQ